ncbi:MAG: hypothetical protein LBF22_08565 [Deltaproteobacteria bacterium]|jgi:hypothetical protein|nr:hypothetical protein [Deltaproteobacteria bacterium]
MKKTFGLFLIILIFTLPEISLAQKECLTGSNNTVVCPTEPGGGIERNQNGQIVCGKGKCVKDRNGGVKCSSVPGGGAGVTLNGQVKCEGSCVTGEYRECLILR